MTAALCALAGAAALAWTPAHIRLESSVPPAKSVIESSPERIELRFSGPVDPSLSSAILLYPNRDSLPLDLRAAGDTDDLLVADTPPLRRGEHVISWRAVSVDGHPASGDIQFVVVAPVDSATTIDAAPPGTLEQLRPAGAEAVTSQEDAAGGPPLLQVLLSGLGVACLLAFAGLLWHVGAGPLVSEPAIHRSVVFFGRAALLLLVAALVTWLLPVRVPGAGLGGFWPGLSSRSGLVATIRILLVILALAALTKHGRLAALLALAALIVGAASGHPATVDSWISIPANAVHLGAAAIWAGGLLLIVRLPEGPSATGAGVAWRFEAVAGAVSASALLAVLLLVASGVVQSVLFVGDIGLYTSTAYGRTIWVKWAGLLVLVGFGAWNRFRIMPNLPEEEAEQIPALVRNVRLETVVFLLVVLSAAFLAHLPAPAAY